VETLKEEVMEESRSERECCDGSTRTTLNNCPRQNEFSGTKGGNHGRKKDDA
jgi:hypothetical protein